jgi:EmrB/QacA subfamily drug resistance transporter
MSKSLDHYCPPEKRKYVIIVAFLASAMGFIDGTIVAIALPQIRASLDASFTAAQWVSNSYILTMSALILLGGGLGDKLGVKRVFVWGVAVFIVTSIACAFAWDTQSLIVFRGLQGIGAAIMLPGSMALIARNTPREERGSAMGIWVASSSITTAMGPFLGGFLLTYGGDEAWRWIFAFNVPIGLIALVILVKMVPSDQPKHEGGAASLDWTGGLILTLGMGALATGLTFLSETDSTQLAYILIAMGVLISALAVWWELRTPNAMIDMRLFYSKQFAGANLVTLLVWTCMGAVTFFLPMLVIVAWNLPPTYAGSMFLPFSLFITCLSPFAGRLVDRFGTRPLLTCGSVIYAIGCLVIAWAIVKQDFWFWLLPGFAVLGLGIGLMGSTIAVAVVNSVPEEKTGAGSGINNMIARVSFLFAVSGLGALVSYGYSLVIRGSDLHADIQDLMIAAGFGERLEGALYQISLVELQAAAMNHAAIALCLVMAALSLLSALVGYLTQGTES